MKPPFPCEAFFPHNMFKRNTFVQTNIQEIKCGTGSVYLRTIYTQSKQQPVKETCLPFKTTFFQVKIACDQKTIQKLPITTGSNAGAIFTVFTVFSRQFGVRSRSFHGFSRSAALGFCFGFFILGRTPLNMCRKRSSLFD